MCLISDKINIKELYNEKIGYGFNGLYPDLFEWVKLNNYEELIEEKVADVYYFEKSYYGQLQQANMYDIAMNRYKNLISYYHI